MSSHKKRPKFSVTKKGEVAYPLLDERFTKYFHGFAEGIHKQLVNSWLHDFAVSKSTQTFYFTCGLDNERVYSWDDLYEHFKTLHWKELVAYAKREGVKLE